MESVIESIFIQCRNAKFGCTKKLSYRKESIHEKECIFSQCSCPAQDCSYTGSYKDLYNHSTYIHQITYMGSYILNRFTCGSSFSVWMNISNDILIKKEYQNSLLFAVQCFREPYGVYVTVSCIAPSAPEVGEFSLLKRRLT